MRGELSLLVYQMPRPVCILSPFFAPTVCPSFCLSHTIRRLARASRQKFSFLGWEPSYFLSSFPVLIAHVE
jgi:hypothetical protein